jgi:hypothetical protein
MSFSPLWAKEDTAFQVRETGVRFMCLTAFVAAMIIFAKQHGPPCNEKGRII